MPETNVPTILDLLTAVVFAITGSDKFSVSVSDEGGGPIRFNVITQTEADLGKVIGKQGRVARSIRIIVLAAGHKGNRKCAVNFETEQTLRQVADLA